LPDTIPGAAARRTTMVDSQVRPADVTKYPIIEAMLNVPREAFVPPGREEVAYLGENLWLGPGRVLLEPRSFAKMLDALDLQPGERVLHVGAGLGYGAAVMARMGARVVALEEDGARAAAAEAALAREGAEVVVRHGPLAGGAPDLGPFDAVAIEGAVEEVPAALLAQVARGGRIAAIFADGQLGTARLGREAAGQVHWRYLFNAGAPVLPGFQRIPAFVL
jgi:protein-L-isoaspartate(D-aspartate) O-methyltransferase